MTARELAHRDMLDRRAWEYLIENHSRGTIYRSLEKFEPNMEQLYREICEKGTRLEKEVKETSKRVQEAKKEHEEVVAENQELLAKREQIRSEIETIKDKANEEKEHLQAATAELEEVQEKLDELEKRDITFEKLTEILQSDIESSNELLERVQTKTEHMALADQSRRIKKSLIQIQIQEQEAASRLEQLQSDILSEENKLDELKLRNQLWLSSIQVAIKAQQMGYTPEILVQVLESLSKLGVKGEPIRSARRLLRRLEKIEEEIELDTSITKKTASLDAIESRYNEITGAIEAVEKDALSGIHTVEKSAKKSLASVEEAAKRNISTVAGQSYQSIRSTEKTSIESVEEVKEVGCMAIDQLKSNVAKVFLENSFALKLAIETYQGQVLEWGDVKEQAGRYTELIKLATVLLGIQQNPDALLDIEPAIITRLTERIHQYITRKWPGAKTKASRELSSKDWGISSMYTADLSSVSSWLVEALKLMERGRLQ